MKMPDHLPIRMKLKTNFGKDLLKVKSQNVL